MNLNKTFGRPLATPGPVSTPDRCPQHISRASHPSINFGKTGIQESGKWIRQSHQRLFRTHASASARPLHQEEQPINHDGRKTRVLKVYEAIIGMLAIVQQFLQRATPPEFQAEQRPVKGALKTIRMAAVVVPFASSGMGGTAYLVTRAVASFLQTYLLLLFLRVLLSWFPTFNWERQPWLTLRQMTDPYLQLFRGLIPPLLGMIDFTPLLGFFVLQWISGELQSITMEGDVEEFW